MTSSCQGNGTWPVRREEALEAAKAAEEGKVARKPCRRHESSQVTVKTIQARIMIFVNDVVKCGSGRPIVIDLKITWDVKS